MPRTSAPSTPRVISPTPTPGEAGEGSGSSYFAPTTRSTTRRSTGGPSDPSPPSSTSSDVDQRARSSTRDRRRKSGAGGSVSTAPSTKSKPGPISTSNGHLSPTSALTPGSSAYRAAAGSRSPSPLGLIPLHTQWRSFIHRHEIPRKALHVSIGFFTLRLYSLGIQPSAIHPWLLGALVPIGTVDVARHALRQRFPAFNRLYVRVCGALMRESEVNERYNGVIWYLLGTWVAMRFMPKDVGVMSILLLSWCDTAASTAGRRWGRYTWQIRRGKSVAGTTAACVVGVATALAWWGWLVPRCYGTEEGFMFRGYLQAPEWMGGSGEKVGGWLALGAMSLWSGIVASVSEAIDVFGWDDNLTIPVLSGIGLWGFLKVFG